MDTAHAVETLPKQSTDGDESESVAKWTQLQCDTGKCEAKETNRFIGHPGKLICKDTDNESCDSKKNACHQNNELDQSGKDNLKRMGGGSGGSGDGGDGDGKKSDVKDNTKNDKKQQQSAKGTPTTTTASKTKTNKRIISKTKINGSTIETTGVLTYIAVTILLVSLIKATVDVSKHIREVSVCMCVCVFLLL